MATLTEKRDSEERQRLLKLAEDYKSKGYEVTLKPSPEDLPDFLSAYRPDMVVYRGSERAVVEVESRFSLAASSSYLRNLAEVIEQHSDWRLDLAMANSEETAYLYKAKESLQAQEIASGLQIVRQIATQNIESAILYAWSLAEATLRLVAEKEALKLEKINSLYVMGQLATEGIVSNSEYQLLTHILHLRNAIAHGFTTVPLEKNSVQNLIELIEQLLHKFELDSSPANPQQQ